MENLHRGGPGRQHDATQLQEKLQAGSTRPLNSKKCSRQAARRHSTPRNAPGRQHDATQLQEMSCTQITRFGGCCWNVFLVPSQSDNYPARMFISCTVKMRSKSAPPLVLGGPPER